MCVNVCTCMLSRALWGENLYCETDEAKSWSDSILCDSIPSGGHSATYQDTKWRISKGNSTLACLACLFLSRGHTLWLLEDRWSVLGSVRSLFQFLCSFWKDKQSWCQKHSFGWLFLFNAQKRSCKCFWMKCRRQNSQFKRHWRATVF